MTTKHPLSTTAGLKRALRPGTAVRLTNYLLPHLSRITCVHEQTTTRDLATYVTDAEGRVRPSFLPWPKAAELDPDPEYANVVNVRTANGSLVYTFVILSTDKDVPAEYRAEAA